MSEIRQQLAEIDLSEWRRDCAANLQSIRLLSGEPNASLLGCVTGVSLKWRILPKKIDFYFKLTVPCRSAYNSNSVIVVVLSASRMANK